MDQFPCGTPMTANKMCPKHGQAWGCEAAVKDRARHGTESPPETQPEGVEPPAKGKK